MPSYAQLISPWDAIYFEKIANFSIVGLILMFGISTTIFTVDYVALRYSMPVKMAMIKANQDKLVLQKIGTSAKAGVFIHGKLKADNNSGQASLQVPVSGSKASGTLSILAYKDKGKWALKRLNLQMSDSGHVYSII